ncbi:MAG TPA: ABC transporter, partial [Acidimicrobium sp.]|nr:ABC transporter [Acidimicrobium sp.]
MAPRESDGGAGRVVSSAQPNRPGIVTNVAPAVRPAPARPIQPLQPQPVRPAAQPQAPAASAPTQQPTRPTQP